mgnify:CR=1 FL=1
MITRGLLDQLLKSGQDLLQNKQPARANNPTNSNQQSGGGLGDLLGGAGERAVPAPAAPGAAPALTALNVPPIAATLPGFELLAWYAMYVPTGTPPAIIERLNREIAQAEARGLKVLTVGEGGAFLRLVSREAGQLGQVLQIDHDWQMRKVNLPLIGAYQAANALVSAGLAIATGVAPSTVFEALTRLQPVRGRLERAALNQAGAPVYVDYAHTPDALEAAMDG